MMTDPLPAPIPTVALSRRPHRVRKHAGWRLRLARFLRRFADWLNPLA
jgi:hypothetical protein